MAGGIVSALFVGWISIGTQVAITKKEITFKMKDFSVSGCDNATLENYYNSLSNYTTAIPVEMYKLMKA